MDNCRFKFEKWFYNVYKVKPFYDSTTDTYTDAIFHTRWLAWKEGWYNALMDEVQPNKHPVTTVCIGCGAILKRPGDSCACVITTQN